MECSTYPGTEAYLRLYSCPVPGTIIVAYPSFVLFNLAGDPYRYLYADFGISETNLCWYEDYSEKNTFGADFEVTCTEYMQ